MINSEDLTLRVASPGGTISSAAPLPDAPYRGIWSFRFTDQRIFSARKQDIWVLRSNITLYGAVLLYGESGTGKSSLINAGLLPKALDEKYVPDRLRVQPLAGRELKVERLQKSEGADPTYLPSNFKCPESYVTKRAVAAGEVETFELSLADFKQQLEALRAVQRSEQPPPDQPRINRRALIIFDQFEEFITLFEEARRGGSSDEAEHLQQQAPAVQRAILDSLVELIQDKTLPVKIVFSFREDYLARLSLLLDRCPQLRDQSQRLLAPSVAQLPEIIRAPFKNTQLRDHFLQQDGTVGTELSEELAGKIAAELALRSAGEGVNLTELQIVCLRLWQSKAPDQLFGASGVKGLLEGYGEEVTQEFAPELREPALALLKRMITQSNTRNVVEEDDLLNRTAKEDKIHPELLRRALIELVRSKLVRQEARRDISFYEIASEYLVPWIRQHKAEREAAEQKRKAREERQALEEQREQAMLEWQRARRSKNLARGLGIVLAVLFCLGAFAGYLYRRSVQTNRELMESRREGQEAHAAAQIAQKQKEQYETAIKVITGKTDDDKLQALEQIKVWSATGDFPPELLQLLTVALSTTNNEEIKQLGSQVLAEASRTNTNLKQSIDTAAETTVSLSVSIHIADRSQLPMAQNVANALKAQHYNVLGIQNVGGDAPRWDNELRYFQKPDEGMPSPENLLVLLKATTSTNWNDAYDPSYGKSGGTRPGQYEIWFAAATGELVVSFADEEGNALRGLKFTLTFEPAAGEGVKFSRSRSGYVAVPPGNYNVTIRVQGYKEVQRSLSMEVGGKVDWRQLQISPENSHD